MGFLKSAVLYTALALGATSAAAADIAALEELREGTMKKLIFHSEPQAISDVAFSDPEGNEYTLADWDGKYVLLNFWATWCAPCRKEMPALNALQTDYMGDDFEVVTIATGRNELVGIKRFFDEEGVTDLPILLDPRSRLSRDMAVLGLPVTVLVDAQGNEIARMRGDAEWDGESGRAIIEALVAGVDG
ncbi:MAG: TlpA disulfide reductase family protein [Pseudomonadota bacterium]